MYLYRIQGLKCSFRTPPAQELAPGMGTDLTLTHTCTHTKGIAVSKAHLFPSLFCLPSAPFQKKSKDLS